MELKIGPYRRVYEAHLKHFRSCGYPEIDAAALPRSIVAQPLPEVALSGASAYLEAIVPSAVMLLAWDSYKGRHIKGRQPVDAHHDLFVEDNATAGRLARPGQRNLVRRRFSVHFQRED
jgi:hypothetical protein